MLLSLLLAFLTIDQTISLQEVISSNWTSCEEFLNNTVFDPETVLNKDWKIFYFWTPEDEKSYNVKFSRPSKTLVDRFKVELDGEIIPKVNWTNAELFMETSIDFSALFVKMNMSGMFRIIPSAAFEYVMSATPVIGLKVVKPGYLGLTNCFHRTCYALAPMDKMPHHMKLEEAAKTLGFYGDQNRSHIYFEPGPSTIIPLAPLPEDEEEDNDLEMENDKLNIF